MKIEKRYWIAMHHTDYEKITGERDLTELEYKYIMKELVEQGYKDLIEMLKSRESFVYKNYDEILEKEGRI